MKQLTVLERQIYVRINSPGIANGQADKIAKILSPFFLEEIKEAWINGFESGNGNQIDDLVQVNSYIKSKYNL